jgi:hypothetical protein
MNTNDTDAPMTTGDELCNKQGIKFTVAPLSNWPDTSIKFLDAEEVREVAKQIVDKWRQDLQNVNICYLFQQKAPKNKGSVTLGSARAEPDMERTIHGIDAVIVIGFDMWIASTNDQKARLCHHEISHVARDLETGKIGTVEHSVMEFPEIIRVWGPGQDSHVQFLQAYENFKKDNNIH